MALHEKVRVYEKSFDAKSQRRKGAKRYRVSTFSLRLCAFASKIFFQRSALVLRAKQR
jgi:hypothetical protein